MPLSHHWATGFSMKGFSSVLSVVSFLTNLLAHARSEFDILCERGRPFRCRRAAVVTFCLSTLIYASL